MFIFFYQYSHLLGEIILTWCDKMWKINVSQALVFYKKKKKIKCSKQKVCFLVGVQGQASTSLISSISQLLDSQGVSPLNFKHIWKNHSPLTEAIAGYLQAQTGCTDENR